MMSDNRYDIDEILQDIRRRKAEKDAAQTGAEPGPVSVPQESSPSGGAVDESDDRSGQLDGDLEELLRRFSPEPSVSPDSGAGAPAETEASRVQGGTAVAAPPATSAAPAHSPTFDDDIGGEDLEKRIEDKATMPPEAQEGSGGSAEKLPSAADYLSGKRPSAPAAARPIKADDFAELEESCFKARSRALASFLAALIFGGLAIFIASAGLLGIELPGFIDEASTGSLYLWIQAALVAAAALCCGGAVGKGMVSLFARRPDNDSYTSLAVFACLVQGVFLALRPAIYLEHSAIAYLPMGALILITSAAGRLVNASRAYLACCECSASSPKGAAVLVTDPALARSLGGGAITGEPHIAAISTVNALGDFSRQAGSRSRTEKISRTVAPITALAALAMAAVSYIFNRDIFTAASVFTAALCMTAPIAAGLASALPLALTNRRTSKWEAVFCGYHAAEKFADTNGVLMRCADVCPPGSIKLHGMKVLNQKPADRSIIAAAAVLSACSAPLAEVFSSMLAGDNLIRRPDSVTVEDGSGVSAWLDGQRVLIGSRELLSRHRVVLPDPYTENRYLDEGRKVLYLSISGEAAAMFILSYSPDKVTAKVLKLFESRDIAVLLRSTDPNVNPESIAELYSCPAGLIKLVPSNLYEAAIGGIHKDIAPAEMVHNGRPSSYARTLAVAGNLRYLVGLEAVLLIVSIVIGFALVTFMSFTGALDTLTWTAVAVYQLFWALVEILIPLIKR